MSVREPSCGGARIATQWIPEQEVIKNVMLKETVDGEFTTAENVTEATLFCAAFPSNAMTNQSFIVSHGWFMQQEERS